MKKGLLIAEKPDMMRTIQKVYNQNRGSLGMDLDFKAFVGHTTRLKNPHDYNPDWKKWTKESLPIVPKKFESKANLSVKGVFDEIKKTIQNGNYDYIINGCDSAREGEIIFHAFYRTIGCKLPVKRLWVNDQSQAGILKALKGIIEPNDSKIENLMKAGFQRLFMDWLIGINFTRSLSLSQKTKIPVGRVMTPTLGILVNQELKIRNFSSQKFWGIAADFGDYQGTWFSGEQKVFDGEEKAREKLKELKKDGVITLVESKEKLNYAPQCYALSTAQIDANRIFGYTAEEVLQTLQSLYEKHKILSYPRTSSGYLTEEVGKELPEILAFVRNVDFVKDEVSQITQEQIKLVGKNKKYVDSSKVEDHHGLIPTDYPKNLNALSNMERNMYELIIKRFVGIFMDPEIVKSTKIITDIHGETFESKGSEVLQDGYKSLLKNLIKSKPNVILPIKQKGDRVNVKKYALIERDTQPPKRYTEGTLIEAMIKPMSFVEDKKLKIVLKETTGIGTESTRADIIEKLLTLEMIKREKKNLVPTEFGIQVIQALEGKDIISPKLTALWEEKLKQVEKGDLTDIEFYKEMIQYVKRETSELLNMNQKVEQQSSGNLNKSSTVTEMKEKCPCCQKALKESPKYYMCSTYKNGCSFIISKEILGKKITKTDFKALISGKETKEKTFKRKDGKDGKVKFKYNVETNRVEYIYG